MNYSECIGTTTIEIVGEPNQPSSCTSIGRCVGSVESSGGPLSNKKAVLTLFRSIAGDTEEGEEGEEGEKGEKGSRQSSSEQVNDENANEKGNDTEALYIVVSDGLDTYHGR